MPRRSAPSPADIASRCDDAVVPVRLLESFGLDRRTIARRCRPGGPWRSLCPGVVKLANGPVTRDERQRAALIVAGDGAMLTGLDALLLHRVRVAPAPHGPVHVLVPHEHRRGRGTIVRAERTRRAPEPVRRRHPVAPVARAAVDAARCSRDRDLVRTLFAGLLQHGHCSLADLRDELVACSSRGAALPRTVLGEMVAGVRSVAEARARRLVARSRLPRPLSNVRLLDRDGTVIAVVDFWWPEAGLVWEIDSIEFHLSPDDYARTVRRRSALGRRGVVVVQTLPGDLRRRPAEVLDELRRCHARALASPAPDVRQDLSPAA
ncbi:hypothetical protein [Pseudonocardia spirodelae]|uniref:DUF559 domain-containing protein n=1 Tax=Pseudonocardia spirodelae TaxID=3133431 RepID=A0ABU8T0B2_9PSEU